MTRYENLDCSDKGSVAQRLLWVKEQSYISEAKDQLRQHFQLLHFILEVDGRQVTTLILNQNANDIPRLQAVAHAQAPNAVHNDQQHTHLPASPTIPTQTIQATDDPAEHHDSLSSISTNCSSCRDSRRESTLTELDEDEPLDVEATSDPPLNPRSNQPRKDVANRHPVRLSLAIAKMFQESFDHMNDRFTPENWLRLAIWWLVKSQTIYKLLTDDEQLQQEDRARRSRLGWESDTNVVQVYADLLKSVWILQELLNHGLLDVDDTQIRRHIAQLQRASNVRLVETEPISDESSVSSHSDQSSTLTSSGHKQGHAEQLKFHERDILDCRLDLLEDFEQIIEHSHDLPQPIDEAYPSWRWFEIDEGHCGYEHERVVHRTFVDAQLGFRNQREKPTSAPYLLLLWTSIGQSGLNISLCNHRGSLNLSRRLLFEDIEDCEGEKIASLILILKFDEWDAEICFLTSSDYASFLKLPLCFFSREQRDLRDPRNGEMAICQSSLISGDDKSKPTIYERPRDVHLKPGRTSSCGLKLFETSTNNTWETTRRLVVFSPPALDTPNIRIESYWIPPDQVQITRHDQDVTLVWSDYQQVKTHRTDTREDRPSESTLYYTYTYDTEQPNRELHLKFSSPKAARTFQWILQLPTELPRRVTLLLCERNTQHAQEIRIYQLNSEVSSERATFAICLTTTWDMHKSKSVIRYVYRDLDWILECDPADKITFPKLTASKYTARPSRLTYPPQPHHKPPDFKGVKQELGSLEIKAGCQHSICRIMQALTSWRLVGNARASKVETPARVGSQTHKGASLQLWQRKARLQLAIRFDQISDDQWVTAPLDNFDHAVKHNALTLMRLRLTRGYEMDSAEMTATNRRETTKLPAPKSKVTIHFKDEGHLARFMNALPLFAR